MKYLVCPLRDIIACNMTRMQHSEDASRCLGDTPILRPQQLQRHCSYQYHGYSIYSMLSKLSHQFTWVSRTKFSKAVCRMISCH